MSEKQLLLQTRQPTTTVGSRHKTSAYSPTSFPMGERNNSEDFGAPRKRRRPAKSCDQCRTRKVRCDLNHPCGPCQRARSDLACSYREGVRDAQHSPTTNDLIVPQSNLEEIRSPNDRVALLPPETRVRILSPEQEAPLVTGRSEEPTLKDLHERLAFLENQLPSLRQTTGNQQQPLENSQNLLGRIKSLEEQICSLDSNIQHKSLHRGSTDLVIPPITPRLRAVPQKTKLYGPTHWLHTAEHVNVFHLFTGKR